VGHVAGHIVAPKAGGTLAACSVAAWLALLWAGRLCLWAGRLCPAAHGGPAHGAEPPTAPEYEVKAAFLFHFASFVSWPAGAPKGGEKLFTIGILGDDPFGKALDSIAQAKAVGGKKMAVRRFRAVEDYAPCHILFISSSVESHLPAILKKVAGSGALLVGDAAGLARRGVHIGFYIEDDRVRFEANPAAAERDGLKLSAKLLRLARVVEDAEPKSP